MSEPTKSELMTTPEMHWHLMIEYMKKCEARGVKWRPQTGQGIRWAADRIAELKATIKRLCEAADFPLDAWLEKDDDA